MYSSRSHWWPSKKKAKLMQNWSGACAYEILSKDEKNENSFSMSNFINRKNEISHSTWYSKWMDECIARTIVQYRKWIFLCLFLAKSIFLGSREKYRKSQKIFFLLLLHFTTIFPRSGLLNWLHSLRVRCSQLRQRSCTSSQLSQVQYQKRRKILSFHFYSYDAKP